MNTIVTVKPNKNGGVMFSIRPNNFSVRDEIDFDNPCEQTVLRAIFDGARSNEPRGFRDVFSPEEITRMSVSEVVWSEWSRTNRDWLMNAYFTCIDAPDEK